MKYRINIQYGSKLYLLSYILYNALKEKYVTINIPCLLNKFLSCGWNSGFIYLKRIAFGCVKYKLCLPLTSTKPHCT